MTTLTPSTHQTTAPSPAPTESVDRLRVAIAEVRYTMLALLLDGSPATSDESRDAQRIDSSLAGWGIGGGADGSTDAREVASLGRSSGELLGAVVAELGCGHPVVVALGPVSSGVTRLALRRLQHGLAVGALILLDG